MIEMKKITLISCLVLFGIIYVRGQQADAWQDDLEYLIQRIEIMHPDPYAFYPEEQFYKLKERLYEEIPQLSEADIVISISELLVSLNDGHTRLAIEASDPQWLNQTFHLLPVIMYPFEDGVYIMAGMEQHRDLIGSKVLSIGKMSVAEAASRLGGLWSHDNPSGEKKYLYYSLSFAEMLKYICAVREIDKIDLILQNINNEKIQIQVPTVSFFSMAVYFGSGWYPQAGNGLATINENAVNPLPMWLKNLNKAFWFEYIPGDKIMYLQINSFNFPHSDTYEEGSFRQLCDQFFVALDSTEAEKLIIDIRANNGGNHVELPILKGIIARPYIDQPDKLFLITGRVTYSAAVHFTTIFDRYTNATIVGEPFSGRPNHYGAVRKFRLPNHPQVEIHCSVDYYQDSEPFDFNITNTPDIFTKMSAKDYQNNIDPAMRAVKDYDQIIHRLEKVKNELVQEYAASGLIGMKEAYNSKKQELLESDYNLEKLFIEFYYEFVIKSTEREKDLSEYLTFAEKECPESIELCYMLAEALEDESRIDEAIKWYSRCLDLNPAHRYARMRLGLIELKESEIQRH